MFENLEQEAFNSYDEAAAMYDAAADNATGPAAAGAKRMIAPKPVRSNFDLTFVNNAAVALNIEIFNQLDSFLKKQRLEWVNGAYTYLPLSLSPNNLIANGQGTVGYQTDGSLYVRGADSGATQLTVSCQQYSMKGLNEASAQGRGFRIVRIRQTSTTDSQIDNEIIWTKKTFLGSKSSNRISPRTFFRPEQFQTKIVDITVPLLINAERGIEYKVNAGETVKWNITIER